MQFLKEYLSLLVAIFLFIAIDANAEESTPQTADRHLIEHFHEQTSSLLSSTINRIDSFFYDDRYAEGDNATSTLRIRVGTTLEEGDSSLIGSASAQISLPHLSNSVQILFEGSADSQSHEEQSSSSTNLSDHRFEDRVDFAGAGIRIRLFEWQKFKFSHDTGFKFKPAPKFFTRFRGTAQYKLHSGVMLRPTQLFFFDELKDGFGETSRFDIDWRLSARSMARSRSELTYTEDSNGAEFFEQLSFFHTHSDESGYGARISILGETRPSSQVTEYKSSVFYKQKVGWPWLALQVEPFLRFPEDQDYDAVFGLQLISEITFGDFEAITTSIF